MPTGLLFDCDVAVADWLFRTYNQPQFKYDRALGLMEDGNIIGAVMFHNWNGANVEVSYYGKNTMRVGVIRMIARFIIHVFDPSRLTVMTSKRNRHYIRSLQKFGFKLEGTQKRYYGKRDTIRNVGVRFVMFRDQIDSVAKLEITKISEAV